MGRAPRTANHFRKRALAHYGPFCVYCGRGLTAATSTLDHYVPKSRGGSNDLSNTVPACQPCNISKGDMLGLQFVLCRISRRSRFQSGSFRVTLPIPRIEFLDRLGEPIGEVARDPNVFREI